MGLLLSVLVECVGVVELLAFCSNISRSFVTTSNRSSLAELNRKYVEDLEKLKSSLSTATNHLPFCNSNINVVCNTNVTNVTTAKTVEVKFNSSLGGASLRLPSPPRLLHIKKDNSNQSESSSSQHFLLAEKRSGNDDIEILEQKNSIGEGVGINRESLEQKNSIGEGVGINREAALPLTKQFILIEQEKEVVKNTKQERSGSPSPIPKRLGEQEVDFRRSPSPYPSFLLPVPRNSLCKEFVDNATASVVEFEEESFFKSSTPDKILVDQTLEQNGFEFTECKTNQVLIASSAQQPNLEINKDIILFNNCSNRNSNNTYSSEVKDSVESSKELGQIETNDIDNDVVKEYDERFLDNLDGISKKKLSRSNSARRSKKKKTLNDSRASSSETPKEDRLSSSSMQNNDAETAKILTEAANVLKNVNREADGGSAKPGASKGGDDKTAEPFWLIFSGEYTKAMNKDWHGQHFCCWQCDESLTGQRYVLRDEHPYCVSCYESVFANACEKCSRIIGIDSKDLSYKDKHWHEACFLCTTCGESLVDRQFGSKGDRIYCGRCYDEQFASRCDGCHEIFRAGTKKMEYKTRQWHEKCFCCCVCKVPIGTQSFIPREQEIYCAKCYEEKFATRCIKCNKVITSGGVTYKNEPWHRDCFTCTHCAKSLAGERFTSRDEKPYCAECFGELFAKRCFACNKPITGIGGTKFISFEDRHWHNDCFFCASCRTSLVGRGFITDQDDIICPECAKQKLM